MTVRPDLPLGVFARVQARERLGAVAEQLRKVRRHQDAETVHDLRVAIRRFSTSLQAFPEIFSSKRFAKCHKRLKRIRKTAGEVRDRDIALALAAFGEGNPAPETAEALMRERAEAAKELRRALAGKKRKRALRAAKAALKPRKRGAGARSAKEGWRPAESACENAVERLPLLAAELFDAGREVLRELTADAAALHGLRLQAKRRRYTLELFSPCYGPELDDRLGQLKGLQDLLGEINDCRASREHASSDEMRGILAARQNDLILQFERFWTTVFDAPGEREGWMLELARKSSVRAAATT